MPIYKIPGESRRWTGPYNGAYLGNLWKTFNIDLDREEGKICLSRRLTKVCDTLDTADTGQLPLGLATTFTRTDADCRDRFWALMTGGRLFRTDSASPPSPTDSWHADTLASSPTDARDMTIFGNDSRVDSGRNQLFVTRDTDIAVLNDTGANAWDANWWVTTKAQAALISGEPHPIEYFPFRKIVLVGDKNFVHTISRTSDTADETVTAKRLTFPIELQIRHIFTTSDRAWFLCNHRYNGEGAIIEWDGFSETYNNIFGSYSTTPLSGVNYRGIPIVINHLGMILEYNGKSFEPMYRNGTEINLLREGSRLATLGTDGIKPRGMSVLQDGLVYINMGGFGATPLSNFRQSAGVWCLNPITGRLYNKYSIGQWGDTDFGNQEINVPGAISNLVGANTARAFILGGSFYKSYSGTTPSALWTLGLVTDTTATRGYFVTQYIPASEVKEAWDLLWIHFKRFINSNNRIIAKAKGSRSLVTSDGSPLDATITWASTTTFTVTLSASDDALAVGDEVEVLSGDNAGVLAHISVISGAHAALQTITIDETVIGSTSLSRARFDRWKKLKTITSTTKYEESANIGIDSSYIQFKIEMRGPYRELEISDLIATSKPSIKIID